LIHFYKRLFQSGDTIMGRFEQAYQSCIQSTAFPRIPLRRSVGSRGKMQEKPPAIVKSGTAWKDGTSNIRRQILNESKMNIALTAEIQEHSASIHFNRRVLKEKSRNINLKESVIHGLMEKISNVSKGISNDDESINVEDDEVDIDNLLKANFGGMTVKDIQNMTEATFPVELHDIEFICEDPQLKSSNSTITCSCLNCNERILKKQFHSTCKHCKKQFTSMSIFRAHSRRHQLTHPFKCRYCGYKLHDLASFVKHVRGAHLVISIDAVKKMLLGCNNQS